MIRRLGHAESDRRRHLVSGSTRRKALPLLALSLLLAVGLGSLGAASAAAVPAPVPANPRFHQPTPILMQHCWACHGGSAQEGGLDLRTMATLRKGGRSGPSIIPGNPEESLLLRRIRDGECPPNKRLVEANVKPVPATSLEKLTAWIRDGALEESPVSDVAGTRADPLVKDNERDFWSFQRLRPVTPPAVLDRRRLRNPVDAFILEKLIERHLDFAPEAPRSVLVRRLYFDLLGLPPTPEETAAFIADSSPDAYENLVDRLLASPHYGERWGRYWLDVAGYSDVEGKREQHLPRPHMYRYRDYVIRSFNADKPYDRFLLEQLAGDELADVAGAAEITPALADNLVATAFLRQGPDPTWANITGFVPDRLDVMGDALDVLGSGVLGLTLKCARCHDHKFDPLPQRDYFRLTDIFKGALDEYNWMKPDLRPYGGAGNSGHLSERTLPYVSTSERLAWQTEREQHEARSAAATRSLAVEEESVRARFREAELAKVSATERDLVRAVFAVAESARTAAQRELAAKYESWWNAARNRLKDWDAGFRKHCDELAGLESSRPPEPRVAALWDRGQPSPTYIYVRGDYQRPGARVTAGVPAVLTDSGERFEPVPPWPGAVQTGRRLAFARWLTRPDHPLTSRVMVNRLWRHHFGRGLVRTLDNFGRTGAAPTHPQLLDWLAGEFVAGHWRMKPLHRLLVTSTTYRQVSEAPAETLRADPDNALFSRRPMLRLDAEALWDACVAVADARDDAASGPAIPVESRPDGSIAPGRRGDRWRRSIYGQQTRKEIPTLLEVFDLPPMNPNCVQRGESNVATQALQLLNDPLLRELAGRFARRVEREAGGTMEARVTRAFQVAFAREPRPEEMAESVRLWRECVAASSGGPAAAESLALTTLCHLLMNSAEFLYLD